MGLSWSGALSFSRDLLWSNTPGGGGNSSCSRDIVTSMNAWLGRVDCIACLSVSMADWLVKPTKDFPLTRRSWSSGRRRPSLAAAPPGMIDLQKMPLSLGLSLPWLEDAPDFPFTLTPRPAAPDTSKGILNVSTWRPSSRKWRKLSSFTLRGKIKQENDKLCWEKA